MSIAFAVDDVTPASACLPQTAYQTTLAGMLENEAHARRSGASTMLAHAGPQSVVTRNGMNPLVHAVHLAFARHYPLTLTPDAIWTTIAQGFALHVRLNAEALRGQFVDHQGRKQLNATCDGYPANAQDWATLVDNWCQQIREHVGSGTADFFLNTFSTSGPVERTVSEIVMMDAFERYFSYMAQTICGIPRVELTGTVEDWREIRRRVELIAGYGIDEWVPRLREICDELVQSACGRPARDFWQCIYKPREVYGGSVTNGWLGRLFPYLETESGFHPSPAITKPLTVDGDTLKRAPGARTDAAVTLTTADFAPSRVRWLTAGASPSSFPKGLSRVPVTLTLPGDLLPQSLELLGGLTGVVQDPGTLALRPVLGWAVRTLPPQEHVTRTKEERERDLAAFKRIAEAWRTRAASMRPHNG